MFKRIFLVWLSSFASIASFSMDRLNSEFSSNEEKSPLYAKLAQLKITLPDENRLKALFTKFGFSPVDFIADLLNNAGKEVRASSVMEIVTEVLNQELKNIYNNYQQNRLSLEEDPDRQKTMALHEKSIKEQSLKAENIRNLVNDLIAKMPQLEQEEIKNVWIPMLEQILIENKFMSDLTADCVIQ